MSEGAFSLLAPEVQRAVWEMGWKELRSIQADAIRAIIQGEGHLLISAGTASGKTEAAFLPILSKILGNAHGSVRVIYVGPLKALINDQFGRLDRLCEKLEIPVHRWHGDVSAAHKQDLRRSPGGIVLITPESLESNFINYGRQIPRLYSALSYVVIDELHSFLGNVRGIHLASLLSRLRLATGSAPRMVGLSATLSDPGIAGDFLSAGLTAPVVHLTDPAKGREIRFALKAVLRSPDPDERARGAVRRTPEEALKYVVAQSAAGLRGAGGQRIVGATPRPMAVAVQEPDDLDDIAQELTEQFARSSNLVFVNSRRTAEELAVRVHDAVAKAGWPHDPFMVHHGSVSKELRGEVEAALKSGVPTTAICSSTLEMGIDIGSVRAVGQVDPPWSVSSLVQRLGRSGRREGEPAIMRLYVRDASPNPISRLTDLLFPELLRGIALTELMLKRWLEPPARGQRHLSTLVHQILSCLKQTGGLPAAALYKLLGEDGPFLGVSVGDFTLLLRGLASHRLVEQISTGEIVLALEGERIASAFDFYATFRGNDVFAVRHDDTEIGGLPRDSVPPVGQVLLLGGRRWQVSEIDSGHAVVWVIPSKSGDAPRFLGLGGDLDPRVAREMESVLLGTGEPRYLDVSAKTLLSAARHTAEAVGLRESAIVRTPGGRRWFPWVGTRCLRTLALLAEHQGIPCEVDRISLWMAAEDDDEFAEQWRMISSGMPPPEVIGALVTPQAIDKFDEFIPPELLNRVVGVERLSLPEASEAINKLLSEIDPTLKIDSKTKQSEMGREPKTSGSKSH
ncbi:MAG: DEAD/DEAH box helicase [Verrucomicrobiota bacterium]